MEREEKRGDGFRQWRWRRYFPLRPETAARQEVPDGALPANGQTLSRRGSQTAFKGPDGCLTENVKVERLFAPKALSASSAFGAFEPGARTARRPHSAAQTWTVASGVGLTQEWGGPVAGIGTGDVAKCPAGIRRWHGARPDSAMMRRAITEDAAGKNAGWREKATDSVEATESPSFSGKFPETATRWLTGWTFPSIFRQQAENSPGSPRKNLPFPAK